VKVECDNQGVVAVADSGYSKIPELMPLVRCLFFFYSGHISIFTESGVSAGKRECVSGRRIAW